MSLVLLLTEKIVQACELFIKCLILSPARISWQVSYYRNLNDSNDTTFCESSTFALMRMDTKSHQEGLTQYLQRHASPSQFNFLWVIHSNQDWRSLTAVKQDNEYHNTRYQLLSRTVDAHKQEVGFKEWEQPWLK